MFAASRPPLYCIRLFFSSKSKFPVGSIYYTYVLKVEEVAHVMAEVAQVMTSKRRKERLAECLEYVNTNTTSNWAAQILMDLKAAGRSSDRTIMSPVGLGLNFRVVGEWGGGGSRGGYHLTYIEEGGGDPNGGR